LIRRQDAEAEEDVECLGLHEVVAFGINRRLLAWTENQLSAAMACIWTRLSHITQAALPKISGAPSEFTGREVDHHRTCAAGVEKRQDIGRRGIGCQDALPRLEVL
jgi:hypothetical protein